MDGCVMDILVVWFCQWVTVSAGKVVVWCAVRMCRMTTGATVCASCWCGWLGGCIAVIGVEEMGLAAIAAGVLSRRLVLQAVVLGAVVRMPECVVRLVMLIWR